MTATFVAAANDPTSGESQASSRVVTKPAGAQIGVFFLCMWIGTGDPTVTPPGSMTLRNNSVVVQTRTATYLKYVDGDSTGTSYTFGFSAATFSNLNAIFFTNVDPGLNLATVPFNTANDTNTTTGYASTSVSTVTGAALAWSGNDSEYGTTPTQTPPTGFTETGDSYGGGAAYLISPSDGTQTASGAASTEAVADKISALVALAPAPAAVAYTVQAAQPFACF